MGFGEERNPISISSSANCLLFFLIIYSNKEYLYLCANHQYCHYNIIVAFIYCTLITLTGVHNCTVSLNDIMISLS